MRQRRVLHGNKCCWRLQWRLSKNSATAHFVRNYILVNYLSTKYWDFLILDKVYFFHPQKILYIKSMAVYCRWSSLASRQDRRHLSMSVLQFICYFLVVEESSGAGGQTFSAFEVATARYDYLSFIRQSAMAVTMTCSRNFPWKFHRQKPTNDLLLSSWLPSSTLSISTVITVFFDFTPLFLFWCSNLPSFELYRPPAATQSGDKLTDVTASPRVVEW